MHSKSLSVIAFCLVCLGILAKSMPKRLAGYYLPNSYNTSTKEYDEPPGMSSRKSISGHFIHKKDPPAITGIEIFFSSSLLTGLYRSQNFSCIVDPFFGWWSDTFQRIRNSELFPLKYTECMVRKHFDSLHCF